MGSDGKFASVVLFDILEEEVITSISTTIHNHSSNITDRIAVERAFMYNGDSSDLTARQKEVYNSTYNNYHEVFKNSDNRTASMIFGGFTELAIRTHPITGEIVGSGHGVYHPFAKDKDDNPVRMWYEPGSGPTTAQSREFFADIFAANVIREKNMVNSNESFFPKTTGEMDNMIRNDLLQRGNS
jgi:hypothetical protein